MSSNGARSDVAQELGQLAASKRRNGHAPKAVILAGGRGTRLAPYTSVLPKPLMPIGERSVLEIVLDQLGAGGFSDITLCVGYLSHLIQAVVDNLDGRTIEVSYVREAAPVGTAGPLRLVNGLAETFMVMNGDVLTTLDYADLLRHHRESGDVLTIATKERVTKIDYGVLALDGGSDQYRRIRSYAEKPEIALIVSMGIYVVEPDVLSYLPAEGHFDFPQLIDALLEDGRQVGAYPFDGFWLDIGRQEDYAQAVDAWETVGQAS